MRQLFWTGHESSFVYGGVSGMLNLKTPKLSVGCHFAAFSRILPEDWACILMTFSVNEVGGMRRKITPAKTFAFRSIELRSVRFFRCSEVEGIESPLSAC